MRAKMPINDQPIAHTAGGRPLFDNTPTVVAMLAWDLFDGFRLTIIRRANEPGKGKLGLPGGYHMRGESWQEAGCRETREEIGAIVHPNEVKFGSIVTDEYDNNLIFATGRIQPANSANLFQHDLNEVQEILRIKEKDLCKLEDWAFPLHYRAAQKFFLGGFQL